MSNLKDELNDIITKFAESGWDVIDAPSKDWLKCKDNSETSVQASNIYIDKIGITV